MMAKPDVSGIKRPLDKLPPSRYEPMPSKNVKLSASERANKIKSIFVAPPKRFPSRGGYDDDEEEDDEINDFIDDTEQNEDPEAVGELNQIFGGYRNRVKRTRHLEENLSDMEVGFEEIEEEENYSKHVARKEDAKEWEYIQKEKEEEERREKMKRKKLQID